MDYNSYLFEQFIIARGYNKYVKESLFAGEEFYNWLREQRYYGEVYLKFIKEVAALELNNKHTIELNKGKQDFLISEGTLISPFAYTLNKPSSSLIIEDDNVLISEGEELYSTAGYNMFVSHNAYRKMYADIIPELYNTGCNICYGVFGKNSDKDKDDRISLLHTLAEECGDDVRLEYENSSSTYYGAIYNKGKVKMLNKIR